MGFKIKNSLTGEFEKLPILTLKGEKGETGGVEEYNKVDYMGNKYETLKQANDANVEYAVKTAIGEFNYLDYEGQHITATDSIEGRSKSAILKGQTLMNLTKGVYGNGKINTQYANTATIKLELLKPSTKYIAYVFNDGEEDVELYWNSSANFQWKTFVCKSKAITYSIGASKANFNDNDLIFSVQTTQTLPQNLRCVVLEYQEGMENWDIPYFTGMQSVKMPVLTTVGKNLFDGKLELGGYAGTTGEPYNANDRVRSINKTYLKPGVYYLSSDNATAVAFGIFNIDGTFRHEHANTSGNKLKLVLEQEAYAHITVVNSGLLNAKIQLEEGSTATSYEPYKTNILSAPSDLELRGIGDVRDELDLLSGELTERIGEVVLDGSEDERIGIVSEFDNVIRFTIKSVVGKTSGKVASDKFTYADNNLDTEHIRLDASSPNGILQMYISKNRLPSANVDGFKEYLRLNPITVQYQLATESIKTVDLSDNHVYSYKEVTHYDCSSAEGSLVPTLSVKVPTDVQATIAQQRETIQTLNSENERLNQIQEALKASMLDSQVQLMNLSWDTDFEVFTLRESIAPKDSLMDSKIGSNIDKFSQAKFIIENDCPDLEKLNSQIEYYFSKDVFSQEQFEELTDLISIVKGGNGCEY